MYYRLVLWVVGVGKKQQKKLMYFTAAQMTPTI
jgi:hypothetical protein